MRMAKRFRIGLIYSYNTDWVAGAYYILNLIQALSKVADKDKPHIVILSYSEEEFNSVKETGYPYLEFHQLIRSEMSPSYSLLERGINKVSKKLIKRNLIVKKHTKKRLPIPLDLIFPSPNHIYFSDILNRLFWIPDFQDYFLPQFFSAEEIQSRRQQHQQLSNDGSNIVFSSYDALNHFNDRYPASPAKTFVLQFAVTHPDYSGIPVASLQSKFSIKQSYFFCPNQVWKHKNHLTVLKAIKMLKDKGVKNILVVFSGKEYDNRNPGVFEELKSYISENGIEENVRFLGFIDRKEQLQLMNNADCVIQPSLFEGWSTSIEDAKAMGQFIIASNLPVHHEQMKQNVLFFEPLNELQLSECFLKVQEEKRLRLTATDYQKDILKFGNEFVKIAQKIIAS